MVLPENVTIKMDKDLPRPIEKAFKTVRAMALESKLEVNNYKKECGLTA